MTAEAILVVCRGVVGEFSGTTTGGNEKFWVNLIPILLIVAVLVALPALSRPTVLLGVSVPTTRLDEPVIHRCMRRYRIGVLACGVIVVLVVIVLGASAVADEAAPFVLLATAGAVFAWARRPILRAKQAGGWYETGCRSG